MESNQNSNPGFYQPSSFRKKVFRTLRLFARAAVHDTLPVTSIRRTSRNILMVVPSLNRIGGYERQALELTRGLTESGNFVVLLTQFHEGASERELKNSYVIHRLNGSGSVLLVRMVRYLMSRRNSIDVVHVHGITGFSVVAARIAVLLGLPVCIKPATSGDLTSIIRGDSIKQRLYARWLRKIGSWIAISDELHREILGAGVSDRKIDCIPNMVDTLTFRPLNERKRIDLRAKYGILGEELVFLFLGRLEGRKGVEYLLHSWKQSSCGSLWIVGSGPEEEKLKKLVSSEQIRNVYFHGETNSPVEFFQIADVFLLPSLKEGFPNVLLEAMSCALPCVATKIGGVTDVLQDDIQGLLVASGSVEALNHGIGKASSSKSERIRWGSASRTTALLYDTKEITKRYVEMYSQMIRSVSRAGG